MSGRRSEGEPAGGIEVSGQRFVLMTLLFVVAALALALAIALRTVDDGDGGAADSVPPQAELAGLAPAGAP